VRVGPAVRRNLGRFEIPAADAYRAAFTNLEACSEVVASLAPAKRILEVGCGDGAFAQRLLRRYPQAEYIGIDVSPEPGRLYRGETDRVTFESVDSATFRKRDPQPFDLVIAVDVLHHVPPPLRPRLMADVRALTAPGGSYMVKEWEPTRGPVHWICWAADRYVTGDRISHVSPDDLAAQLVAWCAADDDLFARVRIPPWRNNYLFAYRRR
jgi:2-polyprenyl-3-methyl-5-hydroxy-6-metoxy-1,4-benzoquinol methylase